MCVHTCVCVFICLCMCLCTCVCDSGLEVTLVWCQAMSPEAEHSGYAGKRSIPTARRTSRNRKPSKKGEYREKSFPREDNECGGTERRLALVTRAHEIKQLASRSHPSCKRGQFLSWLPLPDSQ